MSTFIKLILVIIFVPISWFTWAFATTKIWAWFIVPEFGASPLSYHGAMGLSCLASLMLFGVKKTETNKEDKTKSFVESIINAVLAPMFILFFAWLAHSFFS